MTVVTGDVLRVVASFLWTDGNINQNVYNAVVTGGGGPWDDSDIVDDAEAWLGVLYANLTTVMSNFIDGNEVIVYKWDTINDDWDEVGSQSWTFNPTAAGEQLPRGTAALVRLWTVDPDVQGRKFIPGLTEANLDDGLYEAGILADLLAFGLDWYTAFAGATSGAAWAPGIWSVVAQVFKAAVDHYATSSIPAYQRRRKRNVGI